MTGVRFFSAGPLSALAIILLLALVIILIPLLVLGMIGAAFTRLGLSWIAAVALVILMLAGSFVDIPLYRIRRDVIRAVRMDQSGSDRENPFAGAVWETVIGINFGGGILPLCIASYLLYQAILADGTKILIPVTLCGAVVMAVVFGATREIAGVGIYVPFIIPALTALLTGLLFAGGTGLTAAVTALAGGILGTLAGGNLARLGHVRDLGISRVSIGGSGTFGAVFLCCILPALIA